MKNYTEIKIEDNVTNLLKLEEAKTTKERELEIV